MSNFSKKLKEQYKEHPIGTLSAMVGLIGGIFGIIAGLSAAASWASQYIVSPNDLQQMESRLKTYIEADSALIRDIYTQELETKKKLLKDKLRKAERLGVIKDIEDDINDIDIKIDRLKGVGE